MKKLLRWLTMHKQRKYTVEFIATGVMGNRYSVMTYTIAVSDYELRNTFAKPVSVSDYVFVAKCRKELLKYFPVNKVGAHTYGSITTEM